MADWRRFAVYFAPRPDQALARFGARWLGWDAERGAETPAEVGDPPRPSEEIVAAPRRYGFHATLKAPFRLAEGADRATLERAVAALAARHDAFALPLELVAIDAFLALTPAGPAPEADALAAACVRELDRFRAPLTAQEIARRVPERLTPRERDHLATWGYPYVLDAFRLHLTLTGALSAAAQAEVRATLEPRLAPLLAEPIPFEDLCVFAEAGDGRFRLLSRHPLRGA